MAFGGYVAFSVYLPAYLKTAYGLSPADAANRMAGFVVVAVIMRPVGGWLSDRFGAIPVLATGYGVVAVGAGVPPPTRCSSPSAPSPSWPWQQPWARGAVRLRADREGDRAGAGRWCDGVRRRSRWARRFVPPLIMGYVYGRTDSYAVGLWMLAITAACTLALTVTIVRRTAASLEAH